MNVNCRKYQDTQKCIYICCVSIRCIYNLFVQVLLWQHLHLPVSLTSTIVCNAAMHTNCKCFSYSYSVNVQFCFSFVLDWLHISTILLGGLDTDRRFTLQYCTHGLKNKQQTDSQPISGENVDDQKLQFENWLFFRRWLSDLASPNLLFSKS